MTAWTVTVIGIVHVAIAPFVYGPSLRSMVSGGVIGSVEADPDRIWLRSTGLWYVVCGLCLVSIGTLLVWLARSYHRVPPTLGWCLAVIALTGVLLIPQSGFWALFVPAGLALEAGRRTRSTLRAGAAQTDGDSSRCARCPDVIEGSR